jgi:hypothetical protein
MARKNSGFTLLFEAYAMLLIENEIPVSKAADFMYQLNDKINLAKLGELIEKSQVQLKEEKSFLI